KAPKFSDDFFTLDYQSNILRNLERDSDEGRSVKFFIFKKNDLQTITGDVSISNIVRGIFLSCHLGYMLDENENGKGYMNEALTEIIKYAFNEIELHRIEANIMPSNTRSINLIKQLGFTEEGLAKKYLKINGTWEDHIHYVLLNEKME